MNQLGYVDVESRGGRLVLRVRGEIDMTNAPDLLAEMERGVPNGADDVVVDLSETRYLDSVGVRLLFELANRLESRRHKLRVVAPEKTAVRAVLDIAGFGTIVPVDDAL